MSESFIHEYVGDKHKINLIGDSFFVVQNRVKL